MFYVLYYFILLRKGRNDYFFISYRVLANIWLTTTTRFKKQISLCCREYIHSKLISHSITCRQDTTCLVYGCINV